MKILITGGAGYIGSHVIKEFLEIGNCNIVVIDNLSKGSMYAINSLKSVGEFEFVNMSLEDTSGLENLFLEHKFDVIMHFAAFIEVNESTKNPLKYYLNNVANTLNLITLCAKYGVNKFIFSSTAAVYGEPKNGIVSENSVLNPINPYGKSKMMSEMFLQDFAKSDENFRFAILRYFNVAGASGDGLLGQNYPNATHLIKVVTQTITAKRDKMYIFGGDYPTPDGTCIRDYIHIEDLANAHLCALKYLCEGGKSEVFNVGYGKGFSVKDVILKAKEVSKMTFKTELTGRRDGDPARLVANSQKIQNLAHWTPKHDDLGEIILSALKWEEKLDKLKEVR